MSPLLIQSLTNFLYKFPFLEYCTRPPYKMLVDLDFYNI